MRGCCSGCLSVLIFLVLAASWLGSTWPERAGELLIAVVLLTVAALVQARFRHHQRRARP